VQIRQQVLHILLAEFLIESRHLVSPKTDDVADAVIVGGQFNPGPFLPWVEYG
jgi:hypothetical protein